MSGDSHTRCQPAGRRYPISGSCQCSYLGKNILQLQYIAISPPKYTLQCIELLQYILLRIKILQYILDRLETIAIYIGALFITVPCFNHIILALNRWYWCNILQYIGCNNYCNVLEYCNIYCRSLIYCNIYCQSFRYCNTYCCWQIFPINMQYIFPKVRIILLPLSWLQSTRLNNARSLTNCTSSVSPPGEHRMFFTKRSLQFKLKGPTYANQAE